jgi:hypothetical protein
MDIMAEELREFVVKVIRAYDDDGNKLADYEYSVGATTDDAVWDALWRAAKRHGLKETNLNWDDWEAA